MDNTAEEVAKAFDLPVIDRTPVFSLGPRGAEIKHWLQNNACSCYAIVDDDNDMLPEQSPYFVCTDGHEGLSFQDYSRLCALFGSDPIGVRSRSRTWTQTKVDWDS